MSTFLRLVLLYCLGVFTTAGAATFTFRFGAGFDDPTLITDPTQIGNNPALTLGEARRNMVMEAGRIWGALLVSTVPIIVDVNFNDQTCDANSGTLASAGPSTYFRDFSSGFSRDTFFASALADSLANTDLMQQVDDPADRNNPDIRATFNARIDRDCLGGRGFYYGFDHNRGTRVDALIVALHELAHGFGFASEVSIAGANADGEAFRESDGVERFSTYVMQIFDENLGRVWPMLSPAERLASAVGNAGLAWNGTNVRNNLGRLGAGLSQGGRLRLFAPTPVSGGSSVSHWTTLAFNDLLMEPNISGSLTTSKVDLTVCALRDIGWQTTVCADNVERGATPVPNALPLITVMEDTPVQFTLSATDAENDQLFFNIAVPPTRGSVGTNAVGSRNSVTRSYIPAANASGADSFGFLVGDGGTVSTLTTVTINITPVNDAPTATGFMVDTFSATSTNVGLIGSDVDGDAITFEIVSNPANGTLSGSGAARFYVSNTGFVGTDSFTFRTRDASTTSSIATITINVMAAAATPQPPTTTPVPGGRRGGGGGAMNELLLLALGLLALSTRLYKTRQSALQRARH